MMDLMNTYGSFKFEKRETPKESLHKSLRFIVILSQCAGLMPVKGVFDEDVYELEFTWRSKKTGYSCMILISHLLMSSMSLLDLIIRGLEFRTCNVVMIYVPGLLIHLLFLNLSKGWPKLMRHWSILENKMIGYGYPRCLSKTIKLNVFFILAATFVEYIFSIWNSIQYFRSKNDDFLKSMIESQFSFIVNYIPYSTQLASVLLISNFICMFIWNVQDLFIMVMSTALAERFKQISIRIRNASQWKIRQAFFWQSIRDDYNRVTQVFQELDDHISPLVLLSFTINLYYILVQLFQSFGRRQSSLGNAYFLLSFGMLVLRTVLVSILAARINDESKEPLHYLSLVPSDIYSIEVERLMMQIRYDTIAITGYKLFKVTRGLIFTVAGTVVTYELFLFQLNLNISL